MTSLLRNEISFLVFKCLAFVKSYSLHNGFITDNKVLYSQIQLDILLITVKIFPLYNQKSLSSKVYHC